ncbi:hypothetical protein RugamoR64_48070 [Duganella rhizosphaerae]|uniref:Fic/DOC family N-terminal domain-containing protein n=1 Tax=Duganella rhizosphaerae TaxID=2885763 RepID=UPI0030E81EC3
MAPATGTTVAITRLAESVRVFVPHPLPPDTPRLDTDSYASANRLAELALARFNGVAGFVLSEDCLLYGAVRKEAWLTSQIGWTQATLDDLFESEAGMEVDNLAGVEEIINYLRAFRLVQVDLQAARSAHQRAPDLRGAPLAAGWRA